MVMVYAPALTNSAERTYPFDRSTQYHLNIHFRGTNRQCLAVRKTNHKLPEPTSIGQFDAGWTGKLRTIIAILQLAGN